MTNEQTWSFGYADALGPGPWAGEPDKMQWIDPATGLDCLIVRNKRHGNLCGYVGAPPGHRLHGMSYNQVEQVHDVRVHGGLTFAAGCDEDNPDGICHVPAPGRPGDIWWLGFDCGHYMDRQPGLDAMLLAAGLRDCLVADEVYRTVAYVQRECTSLAAQVASA